MVLSYTTTTSACIMERGNKLDEIAIHTLNNNRLIIQPHNSLC